MPIFALKILYYDALGHWNVLKHYYIIPVAQSWQKCTVNRIRNAANFHYAVNEAPLNEYSTLSWNKRSGLQEIE